MATSSVFRSGTVSDYYLAFQLREREGPIRNGVDRSGVRQQRSVSAGGTNMSSLPIWVEWSIAAAAVLLGPVFGILMAIGVEILIGALKDAGLFAFLVIVATLGLIGWSIFRKLWRQSSGRATVG